MPLTSWHFSRLGAGAVNIPLPRTPGLCLSPTRWALSLWEPPLCLPALSSFCWGGSWLHLDRPLLHCTCSISSLARPLLWTAVLQASCPSVLPRVHAHQLQCVGFLVSSRDKCWGKMDVTLVSPAQTQSRAQSRCLVTISRVNKWMSGEASLPALGGAVCCHVTTTPV